MPEQREKKARGVGWTARRACRAHGGRLALLMLGQAALRAAALAPLLALRPLKSGEPLPPALLWNGGAALLSLLLYLFVVFPLRFYAGERLRFYSAPHLTPPAGGGAYKAWLLAGWQRFFRGVAWGLPFLACAGFWLWFAGYGMEFLPFSQLGQVMQRFSFLLGQGESVVNGVLIALGLTAASALLFARGWLRDMPAEYLPVRRMRPVEVRGHCAKVRRRSKTELSLARNAVGNAAYFLLSLAGFALALIPYASQNLRVSSDPMQMLFGVLRLLKKPLPTDVALELAAAFLLLYLPLCALRKMRNAVCVRRLTHELDARRENR